MQQALLICIKKHRYSSIGFLAIFITEHCTGRCLQRLNPGLYTGINLDMVPFKPAGAFAQIIFSFFSFIIKRKLCFHNQ